MELCDVFDKDGTFTGQIVPRGTPLQSGEYYLVVQVWIRDETGAYLIQQRAPHLRVGAGMWATTAGQVLAGESSVAGAIREVQEELGFDLSADVFSRFDRLFKHDLMQDIWIANVSKRAVGSPTLSIDVSAAKWAPKRSIVEMISRSEFFAYDYFDRLPD